MSGEVNITDDTSESISEYPIQINSLNLRINFLKKEIKRTILLNHDGSEQELNFLLKRL